MMIFNKGSKLRRRRRLAPRGISISRLTQSPISQSHDACQYSEALSGLLDLQSCVGYHLCGAYLKNNTRRYGFRDAKTRYEPHVSAMARANQAALSHFGKALSRFRKEMTDHPPSGS
jgi:hypothetical protein